MMADWDRMTDVEKFPEYFTWYYVWLAVRVWRWGVKLGPLSISFYRPNEVAWRMSICFKNLERWVATVNKGITI